MTEDKPTANSRTVLCVDDHVEVCPIIEALLPDLRVIEAHHAYTALQLTATEPFDLFLVDLRLPDMDGVSLCKAIRKDDPHTPIIVCSGSTESADREAALAAGASAYLVKPVDPAALQNAAAALLEESERRSAEAFRAAAAACVSRAAAYAAFIARGGSRAYFDRKWRNT
jgi:CheY-like chemotaxis protein